jgi:hypothetical protein
MRSTLAARMAIRQVTEWSATPSAPYPGAKVASHG